MREFRRSYTVESSKMQSWSSSIAAGNEGANIHPVFQVGPLRKKRIGVIYKGFVLIWQVTHHIFTSNIWTTNGGWRERNQQDATKPMFIIKLLSQHVSDIIMPIIRRTRLCTTAYGVLHWLCWLWLCGAGTQSVCTVCTVTVNEHNDARNMLK